MAISDHDFNEELDEVVETTIRLLQTQEQAEYSPVAFLSAGGDLDVMSLADEDEVGEPGEGEMATLAREFGEHLAAEGRERPECVFFAHLSKGEDGAETIVVHGATPEGRTNVAYLNVKREENGAIRVVSSKAWHSPAPLAGGGNLGVEVLKGMGV